jgi:hypothetical protein
MLRPFRTLVQGFKDYWCGRCQTYDKVPHWH